jgi:hypothetical protein
LATTGESWKAGGREGAGTMKLTKSSDTFMTSQRLTNALLSHTMSPAKRIPQTHPHGAFTHRLLTSCQLSASLRNSSSLSLTLTANLFPASWSSKLRESSHSLFQSQSETPCAPHPTTNQIWQYAAGRNGLSSVSLPEENQIARPSAYSGHFVPLPSPLYPHCLARDCLRLWRPATPT